MIHKCVEREREREMYYGKSMVSCIQVHPCAYKSRLCMVNYIHGTHVEHLGWTSTYTSTMVKIKTPKTNWVASNYCR
jgi:hypothetical protein